jgi:hypothetical protein
MDTQRRTHRIEHYGLTELANELGVRFGFTTDQAYRIFRTIRHFSAEDLDHKESQEMQTKMGVHYVIAHTLRILEKTKKQENKESKTERFLLSDAAKQQFRNAPKKKQVIDREEVWCIDNDEAKDIYQFDSKSYTPEKKVADLKEGSAEVFIDTTPEFNLHDAKTTDRNTQQNCFYAALWLALQFYVSELHHTPDVKAVKHQLELPDNTPLNKWILLLLKNINYDVPYDHIGKLTDTEANHYLEQMQPKIVPEQKRKDPSVISPKVSSTSDSFLPLLGNNDLLHAKSYQEQIEEVKKWINTEREYLQEISPQNSFRVNETGDIKHALARASIKEVEVKVTEADSFETDLERAHQIGYEEEENERDCKGLDAFDVLFPDVELAELETKNPSECQRIKSIDNTSVAVLTAFSPDRTPPDEKYRDMYALRYIRRLSAILRNSLQQPPGVAQIILQLPTSFSLIFQRIAEINETVLASKRPDILVAYKHLLKEYCIFRKFFAELPPHDDPLPILNVLQHYKNEQLQLSDQKAVEALDQMRTTLRQESYALTLADLKTQQQHILKQLETFPAFLDLQNNEQKTCEDIKAKATIYLNHLQTEMNNYINDNGLLPCYPNNQHQALQQFCNQYFKDNISGLATGIANNDFKQLPEAPAIPNFPNKLTIVAKKYHYANQIKTLMQNATTGNSRRCLEEAKDLLDNDDVKYDIGRERGFWLWLLDLLGFDSFFGYQSKGKQFLLLFDNKYHENPQILDRMTNEESRVEEPAEDTPKRAPTRPHIHIRF